MPASTLSGRSVALLRVQLDNCTPSEGQLILTETAQEPFKCQMRIKTFTLTGLIFGKAKPDLRREEEPRFGDFSRCSC
jgi:hypothetical protein